jgi:hypothetical protein
MLAKLSADILDRLDIFILEIEELQVPEVYLQYELHEFAALFAYRQKLVGSMLVTLFCWCLWNVTEPKCYFLQHPACSLSTLILILFGTQMWHILLLEGHTRC